MKRVLVVDDTKNIRILLTKCLELDGYTVLTATDGQEALELFERDKFDLAFLDIKMPQLSGTEVLKKIREQKITTPVIIITAYATIKNAVECTHMGAVAYLQKPFTIEKVRSVLNELCIMPCKETKASKEENQVEQIENYLSQGEFSKAIELLKITISFELTNPYIYLLISRAYQGAGDVKHAVKFRNIYEMLKD
jgi:two-component system, OmpR family, response regulator